MTNSVWYRIRLIDHDRVLFEQPLVDDSERLVQPVLQRVDEDLFNEMILEADVLVWDIWQLGPDQLQRYGDRS